MKIHHRQEVFQGKVWGFETKQVGVAGLTQHLRIWGGRSKTCLLTNGSVLEIRILLACLLG